MLEQNDNHQEPDIELAEFRGNNEEQEQDGAEGHWGRNNSLCSVRCLDAAFALGMLMAVGSVFVVATIKLNAYLKEHIPIGDGERYAMIAFAIGVLVFGAAVLYECVEERRTRGGGQAERMMQQWRRHLNI